MQSDKTRPSAPLKKMEKTVVLRAAGLLRREAKVTWDSCCSASGEGFVCGQCVRGKDDMCKAEREYNELKQAARDLERLAQRKPK